MLLKVTGIGQRRDGVSKVGKAYDGQSFYGLTTVHDVEGQKSEEVYFNYMSKIDYPKVKLGDVLDIRYDKSGWVTDITIDNQPPTKPVLP